MVLLRYLECTHIRNVLYGDFVSVMLTDRVFTAKETTSQLYQEIAKPLVVSSVRGYNGM